MTVARLSLPVRLLLLHPDYLIPPSRVGRRCSPPRTRLADEPNAIELRPNFALARSITSMSAFKSGSTSAKAVSRAGVAVALSSNTKGFTNNGRARLEEQVGR